MPPPSLLFSAQLGFKTHSALVCFCCLTRKNKKRRFINYIDSLSCEIISIWFLNGWIFFSCCWILSGSKNPFNFVLLCPLLWLPLSFHSWVSDDHNRDLFLPLISLQSSSEFGTMWWNNLEPARFQPCCNFSLWGFNSIFHNQVRT